MPTVNGPQGPTLQIPIDTDLSPSGPPSAQVGPPLDRVPAKTPQRDGFSTPVGRANLNALSATKHASSAPANPYEPAVRSAVDDYTRALDHVFLSNAAFQAQGLPLTDHAKDQLKSATTDFVKALPVGALAPELAASVEAALKAQGLPVDGLADKKIGDLGDVGRDIAKTLVGKFKDQSPAAFYGVAAAGAAAVGYVGWAKGSKSLEKLGLSPEIKKGFFDDHLEVKLKGSWGPHFSNATVQTAVSGNVQLSNGLSLSGEVDFSPQRGFKHVGVDSASANLSWEPNDRFKLSAGVAHDFNTRQTTATVDADWKIRPNVDFALSGSYDSHGTSQIGAGLRIRF